MNGGGGRAVRDDGVLGRNAGEAAEGGVKEFRGRQGGGRWEQGEDGLRWPHWAAGGRSMFCVKGQLGVRPAARCGEAFSTREMKRVMARRPGSTGIRSFLVKAVPL